MGTVLADRERIPLHHAEGERKPGVDLPDVARRQKSEAAGETRANAERERTVAEEAVATGLWPVRVDASQITEAAHKAGYIVALLTEQLPRFRKRLVDLAGISPSALRTLRTSAAFSADNRRDLLNQFVCLKIRRLRCRHMSYQSD